MNKVHLEDGYRAVNTSIRDKTVVGDKELKFRYDTRPRKALRVLRIPASLAFL